MSPPLWRHPDLRNPLYLPVGRYCRSRPAGTGRFVWPQRILMIPSAAAAAFVKAAPRPSCSHLLPPGFSQIAGRRHPRTCVRNSCRSSPGGGNDLLRRRFRLSRPVGLDRSLKARWAAPPGVAQGAWLDRHRPGSDPKLFLARSRPSVQRPGVRSLASCYPALPSVLPTPLIHLAYNENTAPALEALAPACCVGD